MYNAKDISVKFLFEDELRNKWHSEASWRTTKLITNKFDNLANAIKQGTTAILFDFD